MYIAAKRLKRRLIITQIYLGNKIMSYWWCTQNQKWYTVLFLKKKKLEQKTFLKPSLFSSVKLLPLFIYCHLSATHLLPDSTMGNSEVTLITDISFLHHSQQCLEWLQYLLRPKAVNCWSHTHMAYASWATKAKGSWESSSSSYRQEKYILLKETWWN